MVNEHHEHKHDKINPLFITFALIVNWSLFFSIGDDEASRANLYVH